MIGDRAGEDASEAVRRIRAGLHERAVAAAVVHEDRVACGVVVLHEDGVIRAVESVSILRRGIRRRA